MMSIFFDIMKRCQLLYIWLYCLYCGVCICDTWWAFYVIYMRVTQNIMRKCRAGHGEKNVNEEEL